MLAKLAIWIIVSGRLDYPYDETRTVDVFQDILKRKKKKKTSTIETFLKIRLAVLLYLFTNKNRLKTSCSSDSQWH